MMRSRVDGALAAGRLLASGEPAIAYLTRRDVLGDDVTLEPEAVLSGPIVRALMSGQQPDCGFGVHPSPA